MRKHKNKMLGLLAAFAASFSSAKKRAITGDDLQNKDFSTSTQRMGLRFNERIRNAFRRTWIRARKDIH